MKPKRKKRLKSEKLRVNVDEEMRKFVQYAAEERRESEAVIVREALAEYRARHYPPATTEQPPGS